MKILIIGSGGREHCLAWKIAKSPRVKKIFAAPGNPGMALHAECADIEAADIERLAEFAVEKKIDLAVTGPEAPLALGITDHFVKKGIRIFRPSKRAAMLESSKVFCKNFLKRHGIPAADSEAFDNVEDALSHARKASYPLVVKADGLCAGKGVAVCCSPGEAEKALKSMMEDGVFGPAGGKVVIEDCLRGEEVSFMVLSDGENFTPLLPSQDHKAAFEGDKGPNTGGMGAYAPALILNSHPKKQVIDSIIKPVLEKMAEEGSVFRGLLYAGLMLTDSGPRVLEFNARFGDPETQAVLPLLETDIVELLEASVEGGLNCGSAAWSSDTSVCVVMASGGYPGEYETGKKITGLEEAEAKGAVIFQAGTRLEGGSLVTGGGRVLGVTARHETAQGAIDRAYQAVRLIKFQGAYYREDIGWKALKHENSA